MRTFGLELAEFTLPSKTGCCADKSERIAVVGISIYREILSENMSVVFAVGKRPLTQ